MVTEGKGEKYGENSNEKLCRHPEVELRRDRKYKAEAAIISSANRIAQIPELRT
jgi:hypothetical protein